ncbi:MAG: NAD(P)-binding protein [Myxococcota bacterium]|nr:NAD(P)-binding protein [Myxococcota bacterium]
MTTLEELEREARDRVAAVRDDPEARYAMRARFYAKWGGDGGGGPGLGRSELDFLRWEIERGVLHAPAEGGSPWWRAVNERLLYAAELATLLEERLPALEVGLGPVRLWREYMRAPTPKSWYRAHNGSIASGYLDEVTLAHAEPWSERVFVNVVLYRLLYAQGLVEGVDLGRLGEILADPRLPSVEMLLDLPAFYPRHYVLSKADIANVLQRGHSLEDDAAAALDDLFVIPELTALYRHAAGWTMQPGLERLLALGRPSYPGDLTPTKPHEHDEDRPPSPGAKQKIAILGGGLASLSAAYELTSYPGWRDRYEITLYQLGWRVGGKTASGLGPADRIEERGIHIFQGWYHNAFRMVRDAYDYAAEHDLSPGSPLQKWTDGFVPDDATLFTEQSARGEWTNWPVLIPYNHELPGEGGPPPLHSVVSEALGLLAELVLGSPYQADKTWLERLLAPLVIGTWFTPPWEKSEPDWWKHAKALADRVHGATHERAELRWLHSARDLVGRMDDTPTLSLGGVEMSALRVATSMFGGFVSLLRAIAPADRAKDDRLEHIYVLAEFGLANLRGLLDDVYDERTHQFDFHAINDLDYRAWLAKNGLPADLSDCAPVRFLYCGAFHNQYGGAPGQLAADLGLRSLIASIAYRGSLVWKLAAGTGGSLVAPLYKMLSHRGVRFEFFSDVQEIHWSPGDRIEAMTVATQVDLGKGVREYAPLQRSKGVDAWPSHPHYDQLDPEQARRLREGKVDLENPWAGWAPARTRTLRRGIDFDDLVLGIPIRATERICSEIVARNDAWKNMSQYVRTTPTLGVQLWLRPGLAELGMDLAKWGMEEGDSPNSVIYADLLYSWTDMALVLPFEGWTPDAQPGQLSYYCGTWPVDRLPPFSDSGFPERERERLIATSRAWLDENMGWFFPKAMRPNAGGRREFDLTLLVDPRDPENAHAEDGERRLRAQWFTVNVAPSEQYTLAWPGTDRYRLPPGGSGFRNLFLAGDWTDFGLNIGHVEGAVTSGLKAAQALLTRDGQTDLREIHPDVGIPGAD